MTIETATPEFFRLDYGSKLKWEITITTHGVALTGWNLNAKYAKRANDAKKPMNEPRRKRTGYRPLKPKSTYKLFLRRRAAGYWTLVKRQIKKLAKFAEFA